MLIRVMEQARKEDAPRKLVLSAVDAILAEILNGSAAMHELLGKAETLGQALNNLVTLFLGKPAENGGAGLAALTDHFAADTLPEARTAIANRIVAEFKSNKRLAPESLAEELKSLRSIANRIVMGVGKYLSHEDLIAAFTLRSKRLVTQEVLAPYIMEAAQDEKIERLLFVEDNIIGAENKRQLSNYVMPILTAAPFDAHFQNSKIPALQRLAQLQARVNRSGFIEVTRQEFAARLDVQAVAVEARAKLFESIEAKPTSPVEKAQTLIKLLTGGVLTEGQLSNRARELILTNLSRPGFLTNYVASRAREAKARDVPAPDGEKAVAELMEQLGKAGITAETGLKSIAA